VLVRPVEPRDGPALGRLHAAMGAEYAALAPDDFRPATAEPFAPASDETTLWLAAELDGEVVAVLGARLLAPEPDAEREIVADVGRTRLRIEYVVTAPAHRRGGVAGRLVRAAEAWGRERGATVAEATTSVARPFWERGMGYA
jgi:GNAT superfamily N-acetyltransferase